MKKFLIIGLATAAAAVMMTGCSADREADYYERYDYDKGSRVVTDASERAKNAIDGASDAVDDVIEGGSNAVSDVVGGITGRDTTTTKR